MHSIIMLIFYRKLIIYGDSLMSTIIHLDFVDRKLLNSVILNNSDEKTGFISSGDLVNENKNQIDLLCWKILSGQILNSVLVRRKCNVKYDSQKYTVVISSYYYNLIGLQRQKIRQQIAWNWSAKSSI